MKDFKSLGITAPTKGFIGEKIKMYKILNKEIIVHGFKVKNSKYENTDKCLYLQISIGDTMNVVFTGSTTLLEMIEQIPIPDFPFKTTIVKDNDRYEFT